MKRANLLGPWGEALAADYLRTKGYTLVACNYRSRFGEIDIIVENRNFLVFVEVKLRADDRFAQAKEFVGASKQEKIRSTALLWLGSHETQKQPRFDVIEIYAPEGLSTKRPRIEHIEHAFY